MFTFTVNSEKNELVAALSYEKIPKKLAPGEACELNPVLELFGARTLKIIVDNDELAAFSLETEPSESQLPSKFLHASFRIYFMNGRQRFILAVDGLFSDHRESAPELTKKAGSGIRFQPLTLGENNGLFPGDKGRALVKRGLHFPNTLSPLRLTYGCICDECLKPFSLVAFGTTFSETQYFYSPDGRETLLLSWFSYKGVPHTCTNRNWEEFDRRLNEEICKGENFRFYNPLRCPHCAAPYADYEKFPDDRLAETHAHRLLGKPFRTA